MPNYDSITQSDKLAVVFDIGTVYTNLLLVNPKERPVVIVDSIVSNCELNDILAEIFFINFFVPSVLFAPNHVLSLMTFGGSTALVLECGFLEAVVLPVFSGNTILKAWELAPLAFQAIMKNMKSLVLKYCNILDSENVIGTLEDLKEVIITDKMIEDIIVKTCFVSPQARAKLWLEWREKTDDGTNNSVNVEMPKCPELFFKYPLNAMNKCYFLQVPYWFREAGPEILFTGDRDNITLQTLVLRSIKNCPIDVRKTLAENILVTGGTCFIPGLKSRLKEELIHSIESDSEFACLDGLKNSFKFHNPPCKPNYTGWLGAAMFGSLEILASRSIDNAMFLQNPHISDWSRMDEQKAKTETVVDVNPASSFLSSNMFNREDIKSSLRSSRYLFGKK